MEVETALMLSPLEQAVLKQALLVQRSNLSAVLDSLDSRNCFRSSLKQELEVVRALLERV
jgi:hypothetical protein